LLVRELLAGGLLHADVLTMADGGDLAAYTQVAELQDGALRLRADASGSGDHTVLRSMAEPFQATSGIRVLHGNLGEAVIKVSAVKPEYWTIEAEAAVFDSQDEFLAAYQGGLLERDLVAVIRFQGPRANGMPELHKLTPSLSVLLDRGFRVALVTDGRMSGASGKVPAAIHLTPEALDGGPIARLRDGDRLRVDAVEGRLEVLVDADEWRQRTPAPFRPHTDVDDNGRILFAGFRSHVTSAARGATIFSGLPVDMPPPP
jgi:phosphogluconate dehydratase